MSYNQGYGESLTPPATGGDGDQDDDAAMALQGLEASNGFWTPPGTHKSPTQLQGEAKSMNMAGYHSVAAAAGKHSNPPAFDEGRPF